MPIVVNMKVTLHWDVMPCSGSSFLSSYTSFSEFFSLYVRSEVLLSSLFHLDSSPSYPIKKQLSLGTPAVTQLLEETGCSEMKVSVY